MNILAYIRAKSFNVKLFIVLASCATVSVTLLAAIGIGYAGKAVRQSVKRDLQAIASRTAGEVDQYFTGKTDALVVVRELFSYPNGPNEDGYKLVLMMKRLSLESPWFKNLTIFDSAGKPIASSGGKTVPMPEDILNIVRKGDIYRSPMLLTRDNLPYIEMALPLFWQGEVFRVLLADVDILPVWNKIDRIRIGETGRLSILSGEGIYLADKEKERVLRKERWAAELAGESGVMRVAGSGGRSQYVAHAEIPSMGWRLLVAQDARESLRFLMAMTYHAVLLWAVSLIASYYTSAWLSRRISRPVRELHQGIKEVTGHNFRHRVPPMPGKEFSALSEGFNSMIQSLADKEKAERELARIEKLAAVSDLAADVAHEVNNPLAIMKNYIYVIKKKMKEEDPNQHHLEAIDGEIDRVARIISQFNAFYKGIRVMELSEVDILEPIKDVVGFYREGMGEGNIAIEERYASEGKVMGDRDKLKQVFLNLMKNAREAMPDGGRLVIETMSSDGAIKINIADTGTGIKKEDMDKIFDPFFSTKGNKGTGLGLAISYGIIKSMNGDIEVESEAGKGTTFRITLPAVQ